MKATPEQPATVAGSAPAITPPTTTQGEATTEVNGASRRCPANMAQTAFGCPRDFLDNRYVYGVISPRARGLSIGVNLNPDKNCNFECVYCEVDRDKEPSSPQIDLDVLAEELHRMLNYVHAGGMAMHPRYAGLTPDLLRLRHVTLSGDGEPTLSPQFLEVVQTVAHVRAMARVPFFKMVLITNASHLEDQQVTAGLNLFTNHDEIWAKLEAGTEEYFQKVNKADVPLDSVLRNILALGRKRPIVIQSLFPMLHTEPPVGSEIDAYAQRLNELKQAGAKISLVQIYSATRPHRNAHCEHLPLRYLSQIAQTVRSVTGLKTEVY